MVKLAFVVADFNQEITSVMEKEAGRASQELGAEVVAIVHVPGCYEIPLAAKRLLKRENVNAVVALGAVIKGGTGHDELRQ